jgi:hypothetical protein
MLQYSGKRSNVTEDFYNKIVKEANENGVRTEQNGTAKKTANESTAQPCTSYADKAGNTQSGGSAAQSADPKNNISNNNISEGDEERRAKKQITQYAYKIRNK